MTCEKEGISAVLGKGNPKPENEAGEPPKSYEERYKRLLDANDSLACSYIEMRKEVNDLTASLNQQNDRRMKAETLLDISLEEQAKVMAENERLTNHNHALSRRIEASFEYVTINGRRFVLEADQ